MSTAATVTPKTEPISTVDANSELIDYEEVDVGENDWTSNPVEPIILDDDMYASTQQSRNTKRKRSGNGAVDVGTYSSNITRIGRLQCGECDEKYLDYESLCAHLMHTHSVTANVLTISLNSWTEFDLWKQQVSYVGEFQWRTRHSKRNIYALITCHRSGDTEHPGSGKRPPRRRVKIGFECSCYAHAKQMHNGTITVKYCLDHYGHDNDESLLKRKYPQITVVMDDADVELKMPSVASTGASSAVGSGIAVAHTRYAVSARARTGGGVSRRAAGGARAAAVARASAAAAMQHTIVVDDWDDEYVTVGENVIADNGDGEQFVLHEQDGQMYYIVDDANQQYVTINNELVQIVHDPRVQHQTADQSEMFIEAIDDNHDESASNENNTSQHDQHAKDSTPNKPHTNAVKHEQPSDGVKTDMHNGRTSSSSTTAGGHGMKTRAKRAKRGTNAQQHEDTDEILDVV